MRFRTALLCGFLAASTLHASAEDDAVHIVDQFYDLRFDEALRSAQQLAIRYPESPAGPFYLSVAYYQRYLLEDPPSATTFQLFQHESQQALQRAIRLTTSDPALGHYYQGAALGFQARATIAQKKFAQAIPKAREGAKHLEKALALAPALVDAKLGLGLYSYFLARVPSGAKPFAYLMVGMWGDRDKGLAYLEEVAQRGQAARQEARSVLGSIYASPKERQWGRALHYLEPLVTEYPHNPSYRMKLLYVLECQEKWERVIAIADAEGQWVESLPVFIQAQAREMARYRTAEAWLMSGHPAEAEAILERMDASHHRHRLRGWMDLRRGNVCDLRGKPADARIYYGRIHDKKAAALANRYRQTPFPAGLRDLMPPRWPVSAVPSD